tara:strand:- start:28986 stop:29732 length:747 start_codon:yes stop_codon:yes gene_type:complete
MNTVVKTNHPFCINEPDFTLHGEVSEKDPSEIRLKPLKMNCSAGEDNHTDRDLIEESLSRFTKEKINCLDLGCAAGQLILDFHKRSETNVCIGLDGSCGVYKHQNWLIEENRQVLRHANLVENFSILDETNNKIKFDVITCWEVIEHFNEKDLDIFFKNVSEHLSEDGLFFGSIALFPDVRDENGFHQDCPEYNADSKQFLLHKTVFDSKEPWDEILSKYFTVKDYDFKTKLRNHDNSYYFMCKNGCS